MRRETGDAIWVERFRRDIGRLWSQLRHRDSSHSGAPTDFRPSSNRSVKRSMVIAEQSTHTKVHVPCESRTIWRDKIDYDRTIVRNRICRAAAPQTIQRPNRPGRAHIEIIEGRAGWRVVRMSWPERGCREVAYRVGRNSVDGCSDKLLVPTVGRKRLMSFGLVKRQHALVCARSCHCALSLRFRAHDLGRLIFR
jgi:hypothetical protein